MFFFLTLFNSDQKTMKESSRMTIQRAHNTIFDKEQTDLYTNVNEKKVDDGEDNFLPTNEFIEFLNDIRDILYLHRTTFFSTVSEFFVKQLLTPSDSQ